MPTTTFPARRLLVGSGFAVAIVIAPLFAVFAGPMPAAGAPIAQCLPGAEEDFFTLACVPHTTPGDVDGDGLTGASEGELTACSGGDQAECIEGDLYGPQNVPVPDVDTTVHQSP